MFNFFQIAKNTFKESTREPIFFILLVTALALIGHFPSMSLFVFSEQIKLVVDSSMATTMVFGLFAAVLCASHTVSREMRNGTVLLLLSKPVFRWTFVMAKIFGIFTAVILFVFICNVSSIVSIYIATDQFRMDMGVYYIFFAIIAVSSILGMAVNFLRGKSFSSTAIASIAILMPIYCVYCVMVKEHPTVELLDLVYALILLFCSVSIMSTITVVFATRLDMVANLTLCSAIFFLGLISSYAFQRDTGSEFFNVLFAFLYAILPNWQFFWLADALASRNSIPLSYVLWSGLYVVLYMTLCSIWAVAIFQNKEIASDIR
ncbi:MAG: ABC transporter permease subunit [Victivallaceae bacterium]